MRIKVAHAFYRQQARRQLNWIGGRRCRRPVKSLEVLACYISAPADYKICAKMFLFIGILW